MKEEFDVLVLGGGPAGCVTALELARRGCGVAVVDRPVRNRGAIGETLPPHSNGLFKRLKLTERFLALRPLAARGTLSVWGAAATEVNDFFFAPHGNGWHVDRSAFNRMLMCAAGDAGAHIFANVADLGCRGDGDGWQITFSCEAGVRKVRCRIAVDASGRTATRHFGFPGRTIFDHLIAVAGEARPKAGTSDYTLVEAIESGWFYSALLPSGNYMVSYMTDADLYSAGRRSSPGFLERELAKARLTAARIESMPLREAHPAHTSVREYVARRNWLAVGDAARSYDPLSGLGLMNAMTHAVAASQTILCMLDGDYESAAEYEDANRRAFTEYRATHRSYYALEDRWPDSPFWRRRNKPSSC
jgi:flavin-dependent dehydrogenase